VTPKHTKTNYFLKQGLFDGLKAFSDLEKRISALPDEKKRGDAFEVFAEAYLATQPVMQAREVWPFERIPAATKRKFRLDVPRDMGVDGLLQTTADEHHAYQVKFRTGRASLTWKGELSTFIGLSDMTDQKLVFTNSNKIPDHLEKRNDVYLVRGNDLDRLEARDFERVLRWLKKSK
jgi:predicted helicase